MRPLPAVLRLLVHALLLGSTTLGNTWAQAPDTARRSIVEVPAGTLEDALNTFARQAGLTLSFDPALVRGRLAPALSGRLTPAEGLAGLLAPHRLEAVRGPGDAYLVQPSTAALASNHTQLAAVTVTADLERADGPVPGYVAQRSAAATKTDTPLIETPRSVTVVTREQMDDQAVQTVEQSLRYSAGVLTEVTGHDLRFSTLTVRGLPPAEFLDGFRLLSSSGYTGWLAEPQGLERVELLKGPSAALSDQPVPGGAIHMVSKRPSATPVREVSVAIGNHDRTQGSFDLGGPLNADASLLFRLNGLQRKSGSQTDFGRDDRSYIAPALTWKPSPRTTLTLLADVMRDRATPKSEWPQYALIAANPHGQIAVNRFIGEPGLDRYDRDAASLTSLLSHRFDDHWTFRQNARYAALDIDYAQMLGTAFRSDERTLDRFLTRWHDRIRSVSIDHQLEGRFRTDPVEHTLLVGMDALRYSTERDSGFSLAPPIDAFAPVYRAAADIASLALATRSPVPSETDRLTQYGVYVQDQMRSGPWSLGLAVRHNRAKGGNTSVTGPENPANPRPESRSQERKTLYSAGLVYLAANGLAPYTSYSTASAPASGTGTGGYGTSYRPELSRQFEVGLKYAPPHLDALFTLSAFDLRRNNATVIDPVTLGLATQVGEIRMRGAEFEARASLTPQLKMLASLTLLDAKTAQPSDPAELRQPIRTARKIAALWLDHRFASPALHGWSLGGGIRYVGKVPADIENTAFNPAYTLVDMALRYERGPYSFALNATNLFDRRYVAGQGQYFGQGRTLQAKATYRW